MNVDSIFYKPNNVRNEENAGQKKSHFAEKQCIMAIPWSQPFQQFHYLLHLQSDKEWLIS